MRLLPRLALACLLLTGLLWLSGCRKSDAPQNIPQVKGAPQLTAAEIAEKRQQLERSLVHDTPVLPGLGEIAERPSLASAISPFNNLGLMPEWGLQETAADALARIGPASIPALLRALGDKDPQVRVRAAQAFSRMGPEASPAVPLLTKALSDPDRGVRRGAAHALGQIGPAAESAIPALAVALSEPVEEGAYKVPTVVVPAPATGQPVPSPSPSDQR
jgi:HEAT repeat protein